MRYTRYDYKKKKNFNKGAVQIVIVVIMAVVIGIVLFNFFSNEIEDTIAVNNSIKGNEKRSESSLCIKAFQCGVYSTEEGATEARNNIPKALNSIIIQEDSYYKIIVGFYEDDNDISQKLQEHNIDNYKIVYELPMDTDDDKKKNELLKAYLKVLEKISQENVENIDSAELKKWINNNCKGHSEKSDIVQLKKLSDELPDKIKKDNITQIMTNVYNCIKKFKKINS